MSGAKSEPSSLLSAVKEKNHKKVADVLKREGLKKDDTWADYISLIQAVLVRSVEIVNLLLKNGCRIRGPGTKEFCTPLYYAVQTMETDNSTALEIIGILLKAGASMTDKDKNEETPLVLAMKNNKMSKAVELILSMYNVESINPENKDELIHFAIACVKNKTELVDKFIARGIKVNGVLDDTINEWTKSTALHLAVNHKAEGAVKILLSHGADYIYLDANEQTPLHLAYYKYKEEKEKNNGFAGTSKSIIDLLLSAHSNNSLNPVDKEGLSHLHIACLRNNVGLVNHFLQHGVDINKLSSTVSDPSVIDTPLNLAVENKYTQLFKLLLDHQVNINMRGNDGLTPLTLAIKNREFKIAEVLLKYKADVCVQDDKGNTPIHKAFASTQQHMNKDHLPNTEKLLDLMLSNHGGKMANATNEEGLSIFQIACTKANLNVIRNFLENDVDVNAPAISKSFCRNNGYTALHRAASTLKKEVIELLLQYKADVNAVDERGLTPLDVLIESQPSGEKKMIKFFENNFSKKLDSPDDDAYDSDESRSEDDFAIHCVLCQHGDGACHKKKKKTKTAPRQPLMDTEEEKRLINLVYQEYKHIEMIELLVKNNADVNHKDKRGNPLLLNALHKNIFNFIGLPSNRFATRGRIDPRIPYICKRYYADNFRKIMTILIDNGADLNARNASGNTVLHEISDYMRIRAGRGVLLELAEMVLTKGCDPYVLNKRGHLAVTHAIRYRYTAFLQFLLKNNFDPNCTDDEYGTPLHQATLYSYNDQGDRTTMNDIITMLLDKGANVNAVDAKGRTAIFRAFRSSPCTPMSPGQKNPGKAIELLLDRGADVAILDNDGRTAVFYAAIRNNPHCLHVLLDNGADVGVVDKYGMSVTKKLFTYHTATNFRNKTFHWVVRILALHLKRLQMLGRPVNREDLLYCKRMKHAYNKGCYPEGLKDMYGDEVDVNLDLTNEDRQLTLKLRGELETMKDTKINEFASLYNILFKDLQQMMMYAKNEALTKYLDRRVMYEEFPHFGFFLLLKYKGGLARCSLLGPAVKALDLLTEKKVTEPCVDKIFSYLDNKDLEILSRV